MVEIISAATMLFIIMDPLGNLPIALSILKHIPENRRRIVMIRELVIALIILLIFLFAGQTILDFLSIQAETLSIAGGVILFIIAIKMLFPSPGGVTGLPAGEEPFIVPLAMPLIAGPSVIAALLLLSSQDPDRIMDWTLSLLLAWGATAVILMFYNFFYKLLGEKGLKAIERLMGMILVMVATQMLINGIKGAFMV